MTTLLSTTSGISGVSKFFYFVIALAVLAGAGVLVRAPSPFKGLGVGLIAGAVIVGLIVATGPMK